MKLPIKAEYFEMIKSGEKTFEYRDAHITFVHEDTGELLRKEIVRTCVAPRDDRYPDVLQDKYMVIFELADKIE